MQSRKFAFFTSVGIAVLGNSAGMCMIPGRMRLTRRKFAFFMSVDVAVLKASAGTCTSPDRVRLTRRLEHIKGKTAPSGCSSNKKLRGTNEVHASSDKRLNCAFSNWK